MVVLNLENVFACGFLFLQVGALQDPEVYLSIEEIYKMFLNFSYNFRRDYLSLICDLKETFAEISIDGSCQSPLKCKVLLNINFMPSTLKNIYNLLEFL